MTNKTKTVIGIVGGVVVLGSVGAAIKVNDDKCTSSSPISSIVLDISSAPNSTNYDKNEKIYTVDEFCALFNSENDYAKNHAGEKFTVIGAIRKNSFSSLGYIDFKSNIKSNEYNSEFKVSVKFADQSILADLNKGDEITVSGTLFSIATNGIVLQDCVLDSVKKDAFKVTSVKIVDHKISKDYKDADVLVVTYEFYNGELTDEAFIYNFTDTAYQNGVECDDLVVGCDEVDDQTQLNKIQPGITYNVVVGYHIKDKSDVLIKVKDWGGDEVHLEEIISLS